MKEKLDVVKISSIRISTHVHSTEDARKVKLCLENLLEIDPDILEKSLSKIALKGDCSNNITVLSTVLKSKKNIHKVLLKLKKELPEEHKNLLRSRFNSSFSPNKTLFLRLHKQALYENSFKVSFLDDVVHMSIKFVIFKKSREALDSNVAKNYLIENNLLI
ncbi:MAG: RNA-binding domain-containing protein [Promethearchaeota archaeon]